MNVLFNLIVVLQVLSALAIIGLVLVQHGKGADMGAAFGSGASGSLFGASGSSNFLSKSTAVAAAIFFASTLGLAYFGTNRPAANVGGGVMERAPAAAIVPATTPANSAGNAVPNTAPAAPAAPAAAAPTQDVPQGPTGNSPSGAK
jgi:preprotein translocase subunit SecG